jgi:hypothetical protein
LSSRATATKKKKFYNLRQLVRDGAGRAEKIDEELKFNILVLAEVTTCLFLCMYVCLPD